MADKGEGPSKALVGAAAGVVAFGDPVGLLPPEG